jgi:hypothetical protein
VGNGSICINDCEVEAPVPTAEVPFGHSLHADCPTIVVYFPEGQGKHWGEPDTELNVPSVHVEQKVRPVAEVLPAVQLGQADWPSMLVYFPDWHGWHCVAESEKFPGPHKVHDDDPFRVV